MKKYMRSPLLLVLSFLVFWLASCSDEGKYFHLKGNIKGMPKQSIVLEELGLTEVRLIDSVNSADNGSFSLKGQQVEAPGLYRLRLGDKALLVVIDDDNIEINANWQNLEQLKVKGSPGTTSINAFVKQYSTMGKDLMALELVSDSLRNRANNDSILSVVETEFRDKNNLLISYVKQYADTTKSLPAALFAVSKILNDDTEADYLANFSAGIKKRFKESPLSKEFIGKLDSRLAETRKNGPAMGTVAPDFTLNTVDDQPFKLASLRGKYVLIDFWASWCPPCRAENPNVLAAYEKHKSSNFTIVGVSLDTDKDKWKDAIAKDKLSWTHVSDLQGWESTVASLYSVQSIPANFLLDPSGKIIASDLKGSALDKKLTELLTKPTDSTGAN